MCIIKNAPACEVSQIATSTLLSLTKSFLTLSLHIFCPRPPSPPPVFLAVALLSGGSLGVLVAVLSLIKTSMLSLLRCTQVGN